MSITDLEERAIAGGVITSRDGRQLALHVPHTDYEIHLRLTVDPAEVTTPVGKRIRGVIEAEALRAHPASGGGRFIEPSSGEPRIVAGTVVAVDENAGRVLIQAALPMWLRPEPQQDYEVFRPGGLVNCYVRSGATFTPI